MAEKLVIGPINRGLRTDREPFVIDNDSFPTLINAYQWRGRIKRKRGTQLLCRLQRNVGITDGSGNATITIFPIPTNGISSFVVGTAIFTDIGNGGTPANLLNNGIGTATLNRSTGVLTIAGSNANTAVIYFPNLPVMGLEDLFLGQVQYPGLLAFDTIYSYNISTSIPAIVTDVSFYKNPATATYTNYVAKSTLTPITWNGGNYRQFYSTNYQQAFWASDGVEVPFTGSTLGMQFVKISNITTSSASGPAVIVITLSSSTPQFVVGDFVFLNEISGMSGVNFQTGYITTVGSPTSITVTLPNATVGGSYTSGGIVQALTNIIVSGVDCIRWYDGNPTSSSGLGWVNFMPPLSQGSFSIDDETAAQYYLVGAKTITPFKDRILFGGAVIQTSSGNPIYTQDNFVYSQNGTAFYTASYTNQPVSSADTPTSTTNFNAILTPDNETATPCSFFEDQTGFGGSIAAGIQQAITTVAPNEDALIVGFDNSLQTRLIYTGNDIVPFNFFIINSEMGSGSTFSTIITDEGVITKGSRGFIITSQTVCKRFDLDILDQVFDISLFNNGAERFTAQRDFINEWIYFTYCSKQEDESTSTAKFPNQTLQFNYRDGSWAEFNESYTTYGQFKQSSGLTWATVGQEYETWADWNDPWNAGESTLYQPRIVGGNQEGFVLLRGAGTGEATSLTIQNITGSKLTVTNHCLNQGDYIYITGVQGTGSSNINNMVFSVGTIVDVNNFNLNPSLSGPVTYQGGGLITRFYVPQIISKQFPTDWGDARKTRLGPQRYLFTTTQFAQVQLLIFLSQNSSYPYNDPTQVNNGSLIYSTVLYTCPESTNIGLTPLNTNLQMYANVGSSAGSGGASPQAQTWHRINTSLIGDTVQFGITMSDAQMRMIDANNNPINATAEIEFHSAILEVSPSGMLV